MSSTSLRHARTSYALALGLCLASSAGAQPASTAASSSEPSVTLPPALARVLRDYESAWQKKDARALAALFAEDGFVLSNGRPPVRGRAAIQKHYEGAGGPLALHAFDYSIAGATGYIIGGFSRQAGEPDSGKFTLTLRQAEGGRWLIVSDMDNGNQRP
jgi:ketosteroid isomerase-like protein